MLLGGSLMYLGGRELAREPSRSLIRAYCCVFVDFLVWSYGVFQKETSVCVLLGLVFAAPCSATSIDDLATGRSGSQQLSLRSRLYPFLPWSCR